MLSSESKTEREHHLHLAQLHEEKNIGGEEKHPIKENNIRAGGTGREG